MARAAEHPYITEQIERPSCGVGATQTATELCGTRWYWMVLNDTVTVEQPDWMGLNGTWWYQMS